MECSGSVVECLTLEKRVAGLGLISVTTLCLGARHINPCLVLVHPRNTRPVKTKKLLYPPQTLFVVGILFSRCPCVRACVCASVCLWWVYCFHVVRVCVRACVCASVRPFVLFF